MIPSRPTAWLKALGVVLAGLAGRAMIDKLLALRGGAELVAQWAQLTSLADVIAGVTLAGIGVGLTGLVATRSPSDQRRLPRCLLQNPRRTRLTPARAALPSKPSTAGSFWPR